MSDLSHRSPRRGVLQTPNDTRVKMDDVDHSVRKTTVRKGKERKEEVETTWVSRTETVRKYFLSRIAKRC